MKNKDVTRTSVRMTDERTELRDNVKGLYGLPREGAVDKACHVTLNFKKALDNEEIVLSDTILISVVGGQDVTIFRNQSKPKRRAK